MTVVTQRKTLRMVSFETVIKRCPFCLKDTEQSACYAERPDLSVTIMTKTKPPVSVTVRQEIPHQYSWDVMGWCKECNRVYRIMGIPKMRIKEIPAGARDQEVELGITCCDVCDSVYARYKVGEVFIRISGEGDVYLCKEHSELAEKLRDKNGGYGRLAAMLATWKAKGEVPLAFESKDGGVIIVRELEGLTYRVLMKLGDGPSTAARQLETIVDANRRPALYECLDYLEGAGYVAEKLEGMMRRKSFMLTEDGKKVLEMLA